MVIVLDTSALMQNLEGVKTLLTDKVLVIPTTVFEELDDLTHVKDPKIAYRARKAQQFLRLNEEEMEFTVTDSCDPRMIMMGYDVNKNDNKILSACLADEDPDVRILTYDLAMRAKASKMEIKTYDLPIVNTEYKGYRTIKGTTEEINDFFEAVDRKTVELFTNQYVIIHNIDTDEETEMRFDGTSLVALKLPSSGVIKAKNAQQRCALDLLNNDNVPIKIIAGTFGSGKTMLSIMMAQHKIEKGAYERMLLVRNPSPADDIDIGALPGGVEEKVGKYFKSMTQYLKIDSMEDAFGTPEYVNTEIVSYMKGISVDNTIMITDEAEDLNLKLLKMIGTRVGKNSAAIFCGDYKQSERKYRDDNGLMTFIDRAKGNPLVGIVVLDEDVRSSASKVFAII